jgi:uncharacterized protein YlaI
LSYCTINPDSLLESKLWSTGLNKCVVCDFELLSNSVFKAKASGDKPIMGPGMCCSHCNSRVAYKREAGVQYLLFMGVSKSAECAVLNEFVIGVEMLLMVVETNSTIANGIHIYENNKTRSFILLQNISYKFL